MIQPAPLPAIPFEYAQKKPIPLKLLDRRDPMFDLAPNGCRVVVEIGSMYGWWAYRAAKQLPEATIYSIDPWQSWKHPGNEFFLEWRLNTEQYRHQILPVRALSWDVAPYFELPIDFLFIDGNHRTTAVLRDLSLWVPKVRAGGVVVGHDWDVAMVSRAVKKYWPDRGYSIGDLYWGVKGKMPCFWRKM